MLVEVFILKNDINIWYNFCRCVEWRDILFILRFDVIYYIIVVVLIVLDFKYYNKCFYRCCIICLRDLLKSESLIFSLSI